MSVDKVTSRMRASGLLSLTDILHLCEYVSTSHTTKYSALFTIYQIITVHYQTYGLAYLFELRWYRPNQAGEQVQPTFSSLLVTTATKKYLKYRDICKILKKITINMLFILWALVYSKAVTWHINMCSFISKFLSLNSKKINVYMLLRFHVLNMANRFKQSFPFLDYSTRRNCKRNNYLSLI